MIVLARLGRILWSKQPSRPKRVFLSWFAESSSGPAQPSKAQVDGGATPCASPPLPCSTPACLSQSLSLTAPSWIPGSSSRVYMAVRPWPSYHYWLLDASQQARMGAACQSPEPCTLLPSLPCCLQSTRPQRRLTSRTTAGVALVPDTRRLRTTVPPHHARTTYSTRSARSEYNTHSVPNL